MSAGSIMVPVAGQALRSPKTEWLQRWRDGIGFVEGRPSNSDAGYVDWL